MKEQVALAHPKHTRVYPPETLNFATNVFSSFAGPLYKKFFFFQTNIAADGLSSMQEHVRVCQRDFVCV